MDLFVRVFLLYKHIRVYSLSAALCNSSQIHSEAFSSACGFFSHTGFHVNLVFFFIFVFLYCVIDLIKSLKPLNDALQKTADLATDFSDGFYPLQFNDGLATATNLATDLPTDNIPSPK